MNILLEGPDGSGKSTLAEYLGGALGLPVQSSEGPPKHPGEIHERIRRYHKLPKTIFDRHPVVSQVIYGHFRGNTVDLPTADEVNDFFVRKPMVIYCRATKLEGHVVKAHDTAEHLAMVEEKTVDIVKLYDAWALERAHVIYRIGMSMYQIAEFCRRWG